MIPKNFFYLIFVMVFSAGLNAQPNFVPGYYITLENDTVFGQVDNRGDQRNCRVCSFRSDDHSPVREFSPGDITSYRIEEGKYYISKEILYNGEPRLVFLEYLVNGIADLFFYRSEVADFYYVISEDGRLIELTNENRIKIIKGNDYTAKTYKYIGQLKALYSDCPPIYNDLVNAKLSHKSLIDITSRYHNIMCEGESCIIYEKPLPLVKLEIQAIIGYSSSGLDFDRYPYYNGLNFNRSNDILGGAKIYFGLPRINEKLSIGLGTEFSRSYYFASKEFYHIYTEIQGHITSLKAFLGIRYLYPKGKYRPFLEFGPLNSFNFQSDFREVRETVTSSNVLTSEKSLYPIEDEGIGFYFQGGVFWYTKSDHKLGCAIRYYFTTDLYSYPLRNELTFKLLYSFISEK